jgi:poly(3-hydroxybutyrate) depolymerase
VVAAPANHCTLSPISDTLPTLVDDGTSVEKITYPDCPVGVPVVAYLVHSSGHTWPPLEPQLGISGQPTANLDATQVIVDFFLPE